MTLDEALRLSPLGHAYNPELTASEVAGYQTDSAETAMPYVMDRRRKLPDHAHVQPTNMPVGKSYMPIAETRKRPFKKIYKQHPGWVPVLFRDPILNIGSLDQAAGSEEVEPGT